MLSAFENPNQPPMMSPESQSPEWWRVAQANVKDVAGDPRAKIALAMMAQQLSKMGQPMQMPGGGGSMGNFDPYGNQLR